MDSFDCIIEVTWHVPNFIKYEKCSFFSQLILQNTVSLVHYTYILTFCFFPAGISKASRPPSSVCENTASIWVNSKLKCLSES